MMLFCGSFIQDSTGSGAISQVKSLTARLQLGDSADGIDVKPGILGNELRFGSLVFLAAVIKTLIGHPAFQPGDMVDHPYRC